MNLKFLHQTSLAFFAIGISVLTQSASGQTPWSASTGGIYYNGGNVGIGTNNPSGLLHIAQNDGASNSVRAPILLSRYWSGSTDTRAAALFSYHNTINNNDQLVFAVAGSGGSTNSPLAYTQAKLVIQSNGNVGIGTTTPISRIDLGELRITDMASLPGEGSRSDNWGAYIAGSINAGQQLRIGVANDNYSRAEIFLENNNTPTGSIYFKTAAGSGGSVTRMFINGDGRVGIGTISMGTGYKLFVEEGIRTRKVKVDLDNWADYVFEAGYKLRPLSEVERYIQLHRHLPEVPAEAEVKQHGLDLGENQAMLLKKIEELTLYLIELNKRNEEQAKRLDAQEKIIMELRQQGKK